MRALYIEPFAGISGNMLLGALLDAGVPFAYLQEEFARLPLGDYELIHKSVNKNGIQAQYFNVVLPEEQEHHHETGGRSSLSAGPRRTSGSSSPTCTKPPKRRRTCW